jgi:ribosomal protein S18 acetylase RimI-like enzyme
MHIREFELSDYDAVVALWRAVGLVLSPSDDLDGLAHKLQRDGDLFLVGVEEHAVMAVVMGAYDGRRGFIYHLAVRPGNQGRGWGTALVTELERRLRRRGCAKVNLLIEPQNGTVQTFYERLGYRRDDLVFMEKWLPSDS